MEDLLPFSIKFKGEEFSVIDEANKTYEFIGSAAIIDDDGDELPISDIYSHRVDMIARGGGRIPITLGHKDTQVGGTVEPHMEFVKVKDKATGEIVDALRVPFQIDDYDETDKFAQGLLKDGIVKGISISGFALHEVPVCKDSQCTAMYNRITKGNWRSFALCVKPKNRLCSKIGEPGGFELLQKAADLEDKSECRICSETNDYLMDEYGLTPDQADGIVSEMLEIVKGCDASNGDASKAGGKGGLTAITTKTSGGFGKRFDKQDPSLIQDPDSEAIMNSTEENTMDKDEIEKIIDNKNGVMLEEIKKLITPAPVPEPVKETVPEPKAALEKAVEDLTAMLKGVDERLAKLEKAAEPAPEPARPEPAAKDPPGEPVQKAEPEGVPASSPTPGAGPRDISKGHKQIQPGEDEHPTKEEIGDAQNEMFDEILS